MQTYAFKVSLQRRKHFFDCTFDKDTSDESEAFAIWVGFGGFGECIDYESKADDTGDV